MNAAPSSSSSSPPPRTSVVRRDREFDVVIYGATGFTGRLIAEYFARLGDDPRYRPRGGGGDGGGAAAASRPRPVRWAVAGRSEAKLRDLREDLRRIVSSSSSSPDSAAAADDPYPEVVVAADGASSASMARRTRVVLSAAGPFLSPRALSLVGACVESGADYVDITGETPFVRRSMDLHRSRAAETGSYVFHMCGFDSVPSDLGTWYTVGRLRERHGVADCSSVRAYVAMRGRLSGGTLESGMRMERDPEAAAMLRDPFLLGGAPPSDGRGGGGGAPRPEDADPTAAEPFAGGAAWTAPFEMARLNTRAVRRSASELGYGRGFSYGEWMLVPDEGTARRLARPPAPVEKRERLRDAGRLPRPGEGPSEEERSEGWFRFVFVGEGIGSDGERKRVITSVSGGDPGYTETAKMASEAALALVEDRDGTLVARSGVRGGVLTPAWMGDALLKRLGDVGICFREEEIDDESDDVAVVSAMLRRDGVRSKL